MRKRIMGIGVVVCFCIGAMAGLSQKASAQAAAEKPAMFTFVMEWDVPRAMWPEYEKQMATTGETLKKGVEDGTLISYGMFSTVTHQEGSANHGTWMTSSSIANLMKMLDVLRASPASTSPVVSASKHWDFMLSSRDYAAHSGTFTNGYLRVATWIGKEGASDPGGKIEKASMVALCEKLMADGALHAYTIDREVIHSMDPNAFFVVLVTNGAEGLDKFNAAVDDMGKNNPTALAAFRSLIADTGHRDMLAKVITTTHK
ncbi:MAG: hypothetical protein JSS69_08950 [Acidobacteria bacterium]|nr:hypothetical protein [Acidobacteriota bacterium]MBS1866032.1 hypothetical protein [Acidobacteriota bacterium]